jgi:pimeloyl-ACP methyl ester carboxylesterase
LSPPKFDRPLAGFNGLPPPAPDWYRQLPIEPEHTLFPTVAGARIEVLVWGEARNPGILLAHGSRAHARWWGPVAPLLAQHYRVASFSWSGMGRSDWRDAYSTDLQIAELFAAADAAGLFAASKPPVFIAHSFGTRALTQAAAERGDELAGAILVDGVLAFGRLPPIETMAKDARYPSLENALARFTLKPNQSCDNPFILDDIARASLEQVHNGWRWRFDPQFYRKLKMIDVWPALARPKCPLALVHGQDSAVLLPDELAAEQAQAPAGTPFVCIPNAAHHIMADQPIALTAVLRSLIEIWRPSERLPA